MMKRSDVHLSKSARRKRRRREEHCPTYMRTVQRENETQHTKRVKDREKCSMQHDTKRSMEAHTKRLKFEQKRLILCQQHNFERYSKNLTVFLEGVKRLEKEEQIILLDVTPCAGCKIEIDEECDQIVGNIGSISNVSGHNPIKDRTQLDHSAHVKAVVKLGATDAVVKLAGKNLDPVADAVGEDTVVKLEITEPAPTVIKGKTTVDQQIFIKSETCVDAHQFTNVMKNEVIDLIDDDSDTDTVINDGTKLNHTIDQQIVANFEKLDSAQSYTISTKNEVIDLVDDNRDIDDGIIMYDKDAGCHSKKFSLYKGMNSFSETLDEALNNISSTPSGVINSYISGHKEDIVAKSKNDTVSRSSMMTLHHGTWLNDEVINFFLRNCLAKRDEAICAQDCSRRHSHFFNTFFMTNLLHRGEYNYENVKSWGSKVHGGDIFELKYIVCPINIGNMHWTCAIVFMEEKRIQYYDSCGETQIKWLHVLLLYLKDEYRGKNGRELDLSQWTLVGCKKDTPRQDNGVDCGVFMCMFADFVSRDLPLTFGQDHIHHCRDRMLLSIAGSRNI